MSQKQVASFTSKINVKNKTVELKNTKNTYLQYLNNGPNGSRYALQRKPSRILISQQKIPPQ